MSVQSTDSTKFKTSQLCMCSDNDVMNTKSYQLFFSQYLLQHAGVLLFHQTLFLCKLTLNRLALHFLNKRISRVLSTAWKSSLSAYPFVATL